MRLAFFGSPTESAVALRALADTAQETAQETAHEIVLVVSRPDRRRGRRAAPSPSPVAQAALDLGLAVRTPAASGEVADELRELGVEVGVVVAYGQILPPELLEIPVHGFVNVHFSLLPRWRGAAPVERAILAGDTRTGVCLMDIEAGLDTGGVYARRAITIGSGESAGEVSARLASLGAQMLVADLAAVAFESPEPQVGEVTYAHKLTTGEFRLDAGRSADVLARVVRAGNPRPGAWMQVHGTRVKVLSAQPVPASVPPGAIEVADGEVVLGTTDGGLALREVVPAGKRVMPAAAWVAGHRDDLRLDP